jgi:hypothetical protein
MHCEDNVAHDRQQDLYFLLSRAVNGLTYHGIEPKLALRHEGRGSNDGGKTPDSDKLAHHGSPLGAALYHSAGLQTRVLSRLMSERRVKRATAQPGYNHVPVRPSVRSDACFNGRDGFPLPFKRASAVLASDKAALADVGWAR